MVLFILDLEKAHKVSTMRIFMNCHVVQDSL